MIRPFVFVFLFVSSWIYAQDLPEEGTNIGNKAPEIALKNPDGEVVMLSSLKDSVVLIDFWASWCGPCRRENPNVVKAFEKYQHKNFSIGNGFTVYGVSLDKSRNSWIEAIEKDKLNWTNVSDLQYWDSEPAKAYGIRGIPSNFLIDKNGIIVEKNLRGKELENVLDKYMLIDPYENLVKSRDMMYQSISDMKNNKAYAGQMKLLQKIEKKMQQIDKLINAIKSN